MNFSAEKLVGKRILITGATGMVGGNLVHRLVAAGAHPTVLTREGSSMLRLEKVRDSVTVATANLRDGARIGDVVAEANPDVVFHLATTIFNPPVLTASEHFQTNALGLLHLLEALKDRSKARFIFTGSAAVHASGSQLKETDPISPGTLFGASKAACSILGQTYGRLYDLEFIELRVFSAFGPWERSDRLIPYVILKALAGEPVDIGNGAQRRDWVYIDDVVDALIRAATLPGASGLTVNVSTGIGWPVQTVAEKILQLMGNPVPLRVGARVARPDEIWEISGDPSFAQQTLDWAPKVSLDEGIRRSIDWFKQNRGLALALS
jgi:nucleoside-diphosphate-sugar epimerase